MEQNFIMCRLNTYFLLNRLKVGNITVFKLRVIFVELCFHLMYEIWMSIKGHQYRNFRFLKYMYVSNLDLKPHGWNYNSYYRQLVVFNFKTFVSPWSKLNQIFQLCFIYPYYLSKLTNVIKERILLQMEILLELCKMLNVFTEHGEHVFLWTLCNF